MTEKILGLLGFMMGAVCFAAGYALAPRAPKGTAGSAQSAPARGGERKAAEEELKALRALTGYSADIAYGLAEFPEEDEA